MDSFEWFGGIGNQPYDSLKPPGDIERETFCTATMGLESFGGGGAAAGQAADDRWDEQRDIAYASAQDQHEYMTEQGDLAYNDAVLGNEIQKANMEAQLLWQEAGSQRAWDYEVRQREHEFNAQVGAYNKSERLYGAQVGLNMFARHQADESALVSRGERLDEVKFGEMEANLKFGQAQQDIASKRTGLLLGRAQQRSDTNIKRQAATLQQQQKRAEAAFGSEKQLVELMQAAGSAEAKGGSGRTAQKNIQAIMATGGRAHAQLVDQLTRSDSAYNLNMMGLDKSLYYGEAEHKLAQTQLTSKGAYAQLAHDLGGIQRDATELSIEGAYGRALRQSEFDEFGANLAADAKRMAMPGFAPLPPKPLELPRAILVDPMIPQDIPEPREGAGSGGVGAAQGAAQDTAMIVNAVTSLASAALGGWIACDMRVKHEVALLEYTEVDDTLSKLAFAVKALREHS